MWGDEDPREFDMGFDAIGGLFVRVRGRVRPDERPGQQVAGRAILVVAVALAPFRSVAAMLTPTDVVALGRSLLAATQAPLPESVRFTVRVVLVEEPFSTNVATTLLIGDSSDTGTCTVRFAHRVPLKRTVIAPI